MAGLTAPGLGSGLDVKTLVEQLVNLERQPAANRLNLVEARANRELSGLGKLKSAAWVGVKRLPSNLPTKYEPAAPWSTHLFLREFPSTANWKRSGHS